MASVKKVVCVSQVLGLTLVLVTIAASLGGLFLEGTYARETMNWKAQGQGQDWIDMLLLAPALLLAVFLGSPKRRFFVFLQGGVLIFLVYTFLIYAFAVHFNQLFLLYCAGLGLSVYGLMAWVSERAEEIPGWFDTKRTTRFPGGFLAVSGVLFYILWLSEDVPAMWKNIAPPSLSTGSFFTNPVHVLDISLLLPAFIYAGVQLWRRKPQGYLWAPTLLCFSIAMGTNVAFLAWYMVRQQVAPASPVPYIFAGLALVTAGVLTYLLRGLKKV